MRLTLAPSAVRTPRTRTFTPLLAATLMSAVGMHMTGIPGIWRIQSKLAGLFKLTLMLLLPFTTAAPMTHALVIVWLRASLMIVRLGQHLAWHPGRCAILSGEACRQPRAQPPRRRNIELA